MIFKLALSTIFGEHGRTVAEYGIQMPNPNLHLQELCNSLEFGPNSGFFMKTMRI